MAIVATPIVNLPSYYINGLNVSNDATTPNTKLDIAAGQCRDSTNIFDMTLSAPVVINAAANGVNGLDTGSLAASTMYTVFLISSPLAGNATAAILSASATPLMPFGYSAFRKIGHWATDGSSHFLLGYMNGNNANNKLFYYDAPQATAVTSGSATSYTLIDLSALVPSFNNIPVYVQSNFAANAAGDTLKMQGAVSTGDAVTIIGPVVAATAHTQTVSTVLAQISSSKPQIAYKVSSASDTVAINVAGFEMFL